MTDTNALIIFNFENRQVCSRPDENGDPWFVAADICEVLGLEQVSRAVSRLDEDEKGVLLLRPLAVPRTW